LDKGLRGIYSALTFAEADGKKGGWSHQTSSSIYRTKKIREKKEQ